MDETPTTTDPRPWTMDQLIACLERWGEIAPPFTPDERALAQAVAEAWYFVNHMTELPGRAPARNCAETAMYFGALRVKARREGKAHVCQDAAA